MDEYGYEYGYEFGYEYGYEFAPSLPSPLPFPRSGVKSTSLTRSSVSARHTRILPVTGANRLSVPATTTAATLEPSGDHTTVSTWASTRSCSSELEPSL